MARPSKLTDDQWNEVYRLYQEGATCPMLGEKFGLNQRTIGDHILRHRPGILRDFAHGRVRLFHAIPKPEPVTVTEPAPAEKPKPFITPPSIDRLRAGR
jgi:hypothetical protein